jgi:hypothetical protein
VGVLIEYRGHDPKPKRLKRRKTFASPKRGEGTAHPIDALELCVRLIERSRQLTARRLSILSGFADEGQHWSDGHLESPVL